MVRPLRGRLQIAWMLPRQPHSGCARGKLRLSFDLNVRRVTFLCLVGRGAHVPAVVALNRFEGFFTTVEVFERNFLLLLSTGAVFDVERCVVEHKLRDLAKWNRCWPGGEVDAFVIQAHRAADAIERRSGE